MVESTNSYEEQERSSSWFAHGKVISMLFFVFTDLALNSTLDYDTYNNNLTKNIILGAAYKCILYVFFAWKYYLVSLVHFYSLFVGLFGLQVIIEISIFLVLFLATADTFLFRVGLLGVLMRTFRLVLVCLMVSWILTQLISYYIFE